MQTRVGCSPRWEVQALEHWPNKHAICLTFWLVYHALTDVHGAPGIHAFDLVVWDTCVA